MGWVDGWRGWMVWMVWLGGWGRCGWWMRDVWMTSTCNTESMLLPRHPSDKHVRDVGTKHEFQQTNAKLA